MKKEIISGISAIKEKAISTWENTSPKIKWILGIGLTIGAFLLSNQLEDTDEEDNYSDNEVNVTNKPDHVPDEKYWNADKGNWEKDGKPYTYRVTYKDVRDGLIHTHDYADVDNGYEDYQYYEKQWYSLDTQWNHVPPEDN